VAARVREGIEDRALSPATRRGIFQKFSFPSFNCIFLGASYIRGGGSRDMDSPRDGILFLFDGGDGWERSEKFSWWGLYSALVFPFCRTGLCFSLERSIIFMIAMRGWMALACSDSFLY